MLHAEDVRSSLRFVVPIRFGCLIIAEAGVSIYWWNC